MVSLCIHFPLLFSQWTNVAVGATIDNLETQRIVTATNGFELKINLETFFNKIDDYRKKWLSFYFFD